MFLEFNENLHNKFPFLKEKKLLIAVSGGLDSVVLTRLLNKLDLQISLAHCNFHLRGRESDLDEDFVKKEAQFLNLPFYLAHFDTKNYAKDNNLSIQMAARELRYNWFDELIKNNKLDYLLTAHHADDNLETFLINFSRGTGLQGLKGIPERNNKTLRPLLPFTRNEIENYAKENNYSWREDQSNANTKYLRNKLRHEIIPILKELNPNFMKSFAKTIDHLNSSSQIIDDRIKQIQDQIISKKEDSLNFDIRSIKLLSNPKAYMFELLKTYGFSEWEDVYALIDAQSGKQISSKSHRLIKDRDFLILIEIKDSLTMRSKFKIDQNSNKITLNDYSIHLNTLSNQLFKKKDISKYKKQIIFVDKDLLRFPMYVRKWENGDYFYPLGMQGKKKLSKYFKDEKLSLVDKENIWLICSGDDIIWVINHRQDDRFKVRAITKNILKIETK